jgi:translation initiation factor IF-2
LQKREEKPQKIELPKYTPPTVVEEPELEEVEAAEEEVAEELPDVVKEAARIAAPGVIKPRVVAKSAFARKVITEEKLVREIPTSEKRIKGVEVVAAEKAPRHRKPKPSAKKRAKKLEVAETGDEILPIRAPVKKEWEGRPTRRIRRRRRDVRASGPATLPQVSKANRNQELEGKTLETHDTRRRRRKRKRVDVKEVEESIRQTVAAMESTRTRRRHRKVSIEGGELVEENFLRLTEFVSTQELANMMEVDVTEIIRKLMDMGQLISINQRLDHDTIELISAEYGFQVEFISELDEEIEEEVPDLEKNLLPRHPVVTVMGHVDHGKTSLLDHLRASHIISTESGGITQHIGAYEVQHGERRVTFLDTPGHEAFTAMRARGAQVTDIVILVVAADDHVMPQTVEAIDHARAAGVPIVIAISKMDKPNANPDVIKKELADHNILIEEWGGKYQSAEISAKTGQAIDKLLEEVLLAADLLELRSNPNRIAKGVVIESMLDKGRGIVATILVQNGTLKIGDYFHCGQHHGRVRAMFDEAGVRKSSAGPSSPVQVVGFSGPPQAGDIFAVSSTEKEAKTISLRRQLRQREQSMHRLRHLSLDRMSSEISAGALKELHLIVKGDVDGSVQAVCDSLMKLSTGEVRVSIVHKGVGAISETDVLLAAASEAVIIGFHVHPNIKARKTAIQENVEIRLYKVIYEIVNDISETLEGMLMPDTREDVVGLAEVREVFNIPKVGAIAGCFIVNGLVDRSKQVRVLREGTELFKGNIASLKRFKDDAKEVRAGFECGIRLDGFNDIKAGDTLEILEIVQIQRKLADVK